MRSVYVGVGSNIAPEQQVPIAVAALADRFEGVTASPVYRSRAVGFDGEDFLNLVVTFDSEASPGDLARIMDEIERDCGRERGGERFAPRRIDLDLLLVGNHVSASGERPELPRGEILRYAFVLRPLAELAPDLVHPVEGRPMATIWRQRQPEIDGGDLRRVDLRWPEGVQIAE
ncbi:2-amino-4-hydroxy-6-hydroxymethyldihydropteridine diphosphokinase [Natronospira sp.]|uniref:2-amino-4-hydroxy-6- hydroxymethyldihydropteridine diphosphokinase n=1 Tax=Natronospira sp. TaxID=2024970 RepID=UPI003873B9B0